MLEIAKFYLKNRSLSVYVGRVPESPRELDRDELFYVKASELLNFYSIEFPKLDILDEESINRYTHFMSSHFSTYHLSSKCSTSMSGDFFLGWRSYFALDDLLPESEKSEYFWTGAQIEHYLMNYEGTIRQVFKKKSLVSTYHRTNAEGQEYQECRYMVAGLSLSAMHRLVTLDSLADTMENPFSFGVCAAEYQENKQDYLTEDELAVAMSKLLRQRIDRPKLISMLVESSLLEVDPEAKTKRYKLTHIGNNYGFERPRTWHRSVITLLENKGVD